MLNLAIFLLACISVICAGGVFTHWYKDNLLQCIGMSVLCSGSLSMAYRVYEQGFIGPSTLTVLIGVFSYALGTAFKVSVSNKVKRYQSMRKRLQAEHTQSVVE